MTELFYYSRFFGVKRAAVEADLGNAYVVRVRDTPQIVHKKDIDAHRADEGGWWSSMDVWADRVVADAEKWAATQTQSEAELEAEIAELREKRAEESAEAHRELEKARKWRAEYKFDELRAAQAAEMETNENGEDVSAND